MGQQLRTPPRRRSVVAGAVLAGVLLMCLGAGLVLAFTGTRGQTPGAAQDTPSPIGPSGGSSSSSTTEAVEQGRSVREQMDQFAVAPMVAATEADAQQAPLTSRTAGPAMKLPAAADDEQLVEVYPRTVEGAVAQLGAIERAALLNFAPSNARRVYEWAVIPGPDAPPVEQWYPVQATTKVQEGVTERGGEAQDVSAVWQLSMAQVKGVAGNPKAPDAAVVCVLGLIDHEVQQDLGPTQSQQLAWPDCQRMVWDEDEDRWRIGPGTQPVYAPITWPGTDASVRAQWVAVIPHA